MNTTLETVSSYTAGILAYAASHLCLTDAVSLFMQLGSALLLIARIYIDVPRAWRKWRGRG